MTGKQNRHFQKNETENIWKDRYLRILEGEPNPDFSEIVDISAGTIRSEKFRCWRTVKEHFEF